MVKRCMFSFNWTLFEDWMIVKLVFKAHGEGNLWGSSATNPRYYIYRYIYTHTYTFYICHIWLNSLNLNVYYEVLQQEHTASGKDQNQQDFWGRWERVILFFNYLRMQRHKKSFPKLTKAICRWIYVGDAAEHWVGYNGGKIFNTLSCFSSLALDRSHFIQKYLEQDCLQVFPELP